MAKLLKCAIIGYGYMGEIRRQTIEDHPSLDLAWVCDPKTINISAAEGLTITRDFVQVLTSDIDVVFVCTPNNLIPKFAIE